MFTKTIRAGATSLTALALALSLAACGSDEPEPEASTEPTTQEATSEATTPEAEPSATEEKAPEETAPADSEAALDEYIALEQAQLEAAGDSLADVYSEVTVTPEYPDTAVFTYTYAQEVPAEEAAAQLESMVGDLKELCETAVFPAMESMGVGPSQKVTYIYNNPDGSEIWSQTFES
ncbi:hypothetical protein M3148_02120 [Georgenia satyanarayanai]|uniref:hypothetical protein n=1 Tax=Georgenia satyanarayanai TaxID=860221 RepID=UPI00203DF2BF|nr:hypothetical protein [Georgenia satyanarayanai]MCM3659796.1 hypothetical protein [Georgenia satyanarayanai]